MKQILSKILALLMICLFLLLFSSTSQARELVCGIAKGFPPYQFSIKGKPAGFDAEVVRLISQKLNREITFIQEDWDHVVNLLRFGSIDFIAGMEINDLRMQLFDFTRAYYHRYDVVFIREDDKRIKTVEDLYNEIITGDRHSFVELDWEKKGIKNKIRIMQTGTKQESMTLLGSGTTRAAIMPKAVGIFLANQMDLRVKILINSDPGSRVGLAVAKGNQKLLSLIDQVLVQLIHSKQVDRLYNKWFDFPQEKGE
ncbi:MAG: transporter substrate-binding domain-containing protein [Desulfobacterales bacterium]|nr:transporter substrate-binding domain-containing protein [Desulfobacterales bacterium]